MLDASEEIGEKDLLSLFNRIRNKDSVCELKSKNKFEVIKTLQNQNISYNF